METNSTFGAIKEMVGSDKELPARKIRIIARDREKTFEDAATIADQEVENNSVLYWVHEISDGTFEEIEVAGGGDASMEKTA